MPTGTNYINMIRIANEIKNVCSNCSSICSSIISTCGEIINDCETLNSYNGAMVADSLYSEEVNMGHDGTAIKYGWKTWYIHGHEDILSTATNLKTKLNAIISAINNVSNSADKVITRANTYEETEEEIINDLSLDDVNDLSEKAYQNNSNLFGVGSAAESAFRNSIGDKIASSEDRAENNDFIPPDKILTKYWGDKPLKWEKNSNGTYTIQQQDDNGTYVVMGRTNEAGYNAYKDAIKHAVIGTGTYWAYKNGKTYQVTYDVKDPTKEHKYTPDAATKNNSNSRSGYYNSGYGTYGRYRSIPTKDGEILEYANGAREERYSDGRPSKLLTSGNASSSSYTFSSGNAARTGNASSAGMGQVKADNHDNRMDKIGYYAKTESDDDSKSITYPDGFETTMKQGGYTVSKYPDGTVCAKKGDHVITKYPNGVKVNEMGGKQIASYNGRKLFEPYIDKDGTECQLVLDDEGNVWIESEDERGGMYRHWKVNDDGSKGEMYDSYSMGSWKEISNTELYGIKSDF